MGAGTQRAQKTKTALRIALARLLGRKVPEDITVDEVVEMAQIRRATFYAHYPDMDALFQDTEDWMLTELDALLPPPGEYSREDMYRILSQHLYRNAEFSTAFSRDSRFAQRIAHWLEAALETCADENDRGRAREYLISYHVGGCVALLHRWIRERFPYPPYDMARLLSRLEQNMDTFSL